MFATATTAAPGRQSYDQTTRCACLAGTLSRSRSPVVTAAFDSTRTNSGADAPRYDVTD